jgi:serine protease Do
MTARTAAAVATQRRQLLLGLGAGSLVMAWPTASRAQQLTSIVSAMRGSVIPVGTYSATDNPRFGFRGTGFAVGDGSLIATNFHVLPNSADVEGDQALSVLIPRNAETGAVRRARVVATDRPRDLALLRIEGAPLKPLVLDDQAAREGQSIGLMGFPIAGTLGFSPVTHRGIVASITTAAMPAPTAQQLDPRALARLRDGNFEVLQLDATAYPGNSGGPVFDADSGRVLGVVNMVLVKNNRESALSSPTGISYAVPVRYLVDLIKSR